MGGREGEAGWCRQYFRQSPEIAELGCDHGIKSGVAAHQVHIAGERVHAGDEFRRDCRIVKIEIALDHLGDQRGFGFGKLLRATSVARLTSAFSAF